MKFIFNHPAIFTVLFFLYLSPLNAQTTAITPAFTSTSDALLLTKHIPGKPNDMNDWLSNIAFDSIGGFYILTSHAELLHFTSAGDLKAEIKIGKPENFIIDHVGNFYFLNEAGLIEEYGKSINFISQWPHHSIPTASKDGTADIPKILSMKMDGDGHVCILKDDFEFIRLDEKLKEIGNIVLKAKNNRIFPSKLFPTDFAIDSFGNVFVTFREGFVMEFDSSGQYVRESCGCGSKKGELDDPGAICCDRDNNLFICDEQNRRIVKLNSSLEFQTQWKVEGQFNGGPSNVSTDSAGNIWVLAQNYIYKFNGTLIAQKTIQDRQNNDVAKQVSQCFSIDENGNISKSFWNYSPRVRLNTANITILQTKENLPSLAGQVLNCFKYERSISDIYNHLETGIDKDEANDEDATEQEIQKVKKGKLLVKHLIDLGFKSPSELTGEAWDIEFLKKTKEGYLWGFIGNLYFVPKEDPTKAIFVYKNSMEVDDENIEKISEGYWRIYIQYRGMVGRGASERYIDVYDLDMNNKQVISMEVGDSKRDVLDLDSDGKKELIVVEDVAIGRIEWPWIFKWDGKSWVDVSKNYPNYYKNENYTGEWGDWGAGDKETYQKVFGAIQKAAQMGGPSAFAK